MTYSMARRRQFMTTSLDPEKAPRIAPALLAVRELLSNGDWWPHEDLIDQASDASDLALDTIKAKIHEAVAVGFLQKRGKWSPRRGGWPKPVIPATDTREYRLIEWPLPE